jgi:hypothetical protein
MIYKQMTNIAVFYLTFNALISLVPVLDLQFNPTSVILVALAIKIGLFTGYRSEMEKKNFDNTVNTTEFNRIVGKGLDKVSILNKDI